MKWVKELKEMLHELASMIWPNICEVCHTSLVKGEESICLGCLTALPRTFMHKQSFNEIHQRIATVGVPIDRAAAYFYYVRGDRYTSLILSAKYRNRPRIARGLGVRFAHELLPDGFFDDIDMIVPVPMHILKMARRGFNQTEWIARGLSEASGVVVNKSLLACRPHSSQTHYSVEERLENSRGTYYATPRASTEAAGKHILIVDDVLTTGSTLTACCEAIIKAAPSAKISVLTLGLTRLA